MGKSSKFNKNICIRWSHMFLNYIEASFKKALQFVYRQVKEAKIQE